MGSKVSSVLTLNRLSRSNNLKGKEQRCRGGRGTKPKSRTVWFTIIMVGKEMTDLNHPSPATNRSVNRLWKTFGDHSLRNSHPFLSMKRYTRVPVTNVTAPQSYSEREAGRRPTRTPGLRNPSSSTPSRHTTLETGDTTLETPLHECPRR